MNCTIVALVCCIAGFAVGTIVTIVITLCWPFGQSSVTDPNQKHDTEP